MSSLSSGDRLLHFRILSKLGQGGMGEVYLAEDQKLGRKVALKILSGSAVASDNARRRLIQEARSASALNHVNIVTIHSIEELDGTDFIVMEYVEGETLAARLQRGTLSLPGLIDINCQIAEGLAAAHEAGIIHRDIKSPNILITKTGRVKVLDFGLAKATAVSVEDLPTGFQEITEEGMILGTISYMSPEQVRGEVLDSRSDIFSFGCVLYECATGRLPFRGPNPTSVLYQITTAAVIPPSTLRTDLPKEFDAIIMRALAKEKNFRYSSTREIGDDLSALNFPETMAVSVHSGTFAMSKRDEGFVGREMELGKLQEHFQNVMAASGSTVFLTGEPGIGKTSLAEEFLRRIVSSFPEILTGRGRCVEHYGTGEAYLPFLDAIGAALNGPLKDKLTKVLRTHAPTWCMQFPAAFASTGALENSKKEAATASKERMLREISDALIELSATSPVVLFFEDLHWADPSSADLLRYLCRRVQGQRMFILGTLREEDLESGNAPMKACRLDLQAHSISSEIHMDLLSQAQVEQYLNELYSPNIFPKDLSRTVFQKTEGHPLFITSLLQFLVTQSVIFKQDNVWTVDPSFSETDLKMPENVRSMIRTKMEAIPEDDRRILQYASIEGAEFTSLIVSELLGMDEIELEEQLTLMERRHRMIHKTDEEDWPDGSLVTKYRFVHALYQDAFYSDIVTKRRMQLHKLAGQSLVKHYAGKTNKIANKLASHFQLGRDFERAVEYLILAADHATTIHAHAEAAHLYGQALKQIGELLTKEPERWRQAGATLHENRANAFARLGQQEDAKNELLSALELRDSSDVLSIARIHRKIAKAVETQRLMQEAFEHYTQAQVLLDQNLENQNIEWQRDWLELSLDKTWLYYTQNQLPQMTDLISAMAPLVERVGTAAQRVHFYQSRILLNNRENRYRISDETMQLVERTLEAAEETGVPAEAALSTFIAGFCSLWRGDLDRSEKFLKLSLSQILRVGDAVLQSRCLTYLTVLYRKRTRVEEASSYAERSLELATSINMQEYVAAARANLGWLKWRANEIMESKDLCSEALQIWRSLPLVSPFQELALWPLIGIALQENELKEACRHASFILDPTQRQLDPEFEDLLRSAVQSPPEKARQLLEQAARVAKSEGYL